MLPRFIPTSTFLVTTAQLCFCEFFLDFTYTWDHVAFPFCVGLNSPLPACIYGGGGLVAQMSLILMTPCAVACQALLSTEFPRQEQWSGLPFPSPGDLANPWVEPTSPALQADSLLLTTHTHTHTHTPHCLHSSIYGHLSCVCVLAVVNRAPWCLKAWKIQWRLVPNVSCSFWHTHKHARTYTRITRLPHQKFYFLCAFGFSVLFKLYLGLFWMTCFCQKLWW